MSKVILLVIAATTFAQIVPSCDGGSTEVVGWVEGKRVDRLAGAYLITINHAEYDVPGYFWADVRVGDLVKRDGLVWTIVKRGS